MRAFITLLCFGILVEASTAQAQATRRKDATWKEIFEGPFTSPRLFAMPVADVVGAFQLNLSYDGSLLQEQGVLSSAGVVAIGFGDIMQLEYRHTSAISVEGTTAPIGTVGVQLKAPLPERRWWPALAIALRIGVTREQQFGDITVNETVTDVYFVGRERLGRLTLHGGVRASKATLETGGSAVAATVDEWLVLPSAGVEIEMTRDARLVAEAGLVPAFVFDLDAPSAEPTVGRALMGRFGVRWRVLPSFALDASVGYHIEAPRLSPAEMRGAHVVNWDIRLGGELFIPWGAMACRSVGIFCE